MTQQVQKQQQTPTKLKALEDLFDYLHNLDKKKGENTEYYNKNPKKDHELKAKFMAQFNPQPYDKEA